MIKIMKTQNKISGKLIIDITVITMIVIMSACNSKKDSKKDNPIAKSKVSLVDSVMKPVDSFILQKMEENKVIGLGAAIIVNKELVWTKGFGYANKEKEIPFTPNTIMSIASISKTFTGVTLMKAVEEGLVSLDEDINTYLPFNVVNPNFPNEKITLRHLATHTSSLADDYDIYDKTYNYSNKKSESLGDFLKSYFTTKGKNYSKKNFLNKKPGTYRDYSNIAAGLAGYIVEIQTGESLSDYGKNKIFEPLKMNSTTWSLLDVNLDEETSWPRWKV